MSSFRFLKLRGVEFNNPNLPVIESYTDKIKSIPGLLGWHTFDPAFVTQAASGRILSVSDRAGGNAMLEVFNNDETYAPAFVYDNTLQRWYGNIDNTRPDAMKWSGVFPTGAGAKHTKVFIGNIGTPGGNWQILSCNVPTVGRHAMFVNSQSRLQNTIYSADGTDLGCNVQQPAAFNANALFMASHNQSTGIAAALINTSKAISEIDTQSMVSNADCYFSAIDSTPPVALEGFKGRAYDVLIFNTDLLTDSANAGHLQVLQEYANKAYGAASVSV